MILIDANALVVLLIGMIDPKLFETHKTTSVYEKQDFEELVSVIGRLEDLIVLPNVWTEVDNLLNRFSGNYRYRYIQHITETIKSTTEVYLKSTEAVANDAFFDVGLTDSLLLIHGKKCALLITDDSKLSDYANAFGIRVFDLKLNRNLRLS